MKEIIEAVCHQKPGYKWCLWSSSSNFPLAFAWSPASYLCAFLSGCACVLVLLSRLMLELGHCWAGLSSSGSDFSLWSSVKPLLLSSISPIFNQKLELNHKPDCQLESSSHLAESSSGGEGGQRGQAHRGRQEKLCTVQSVVILLLVHPVRLYSPLNINICFHICSYSMLYRRYIMIIVAPGIFTSMSSATNILLTSGFYQY